MISQDAFTGSKRGKTKKGKEIAILVGLRLPEISSEEAEESLEELARLADTAGAEVVDKVIQARKTFNAAYYIGKGKVEEIKALAKEHGANLLIFDDDLKPRQVRNLENDTEIRVIDRTELILDIFALRARKKESKIQVELAQLEYTLPRLKRMWTHLSKIEGGIGMRGPGETQLEVDKRLIRTKISNLKKTLKKIEQNRKTRYKSRKGMINVSLIGYTNAGKSTILNSLTKAEVFCEDRLFATLDTTTKRLYLKEGLTILLSDTVGFIKKLPSHLVESFKSTLEELKMAHILLHTIDISHGDFEGHIKSVADTLKQIGVEEKPLIYVFNKIDRLENPGLIKHLSAAYPDSIFISATEKKGLDDLREKIFSLTEKLDTVYG